MKTTERFFMTALALLMTACSSNNDELPQQPANNMITITAKLAPKDGSITRAISDQSTCIKADWAVNEQLKIICGIYTATANIDAVDGCGMATVSFSIDANAVNQNCTIVYPASAATTTGAKTYADILATQDGTLDADFDVRVGKGKILTTGTLDVTTQPATQFAIFKLTLKDIDGSNDVSASNVVISDQARTICAVTPALGYDKVMYVALPTTATTLKFLVTSPTGRKYFNMASGLTIGTNYYPSIVKLATAGDVILSTGKCAKAGTIGSVAMITYLGNDAETNTTYNHGLALALSDTYTKAKWCPQYSATCQDIQYGNETLAKGDMAGIANTDALVSHSGHVHTAASAARNYNNGIHPTGTSEWFLPSAGQWKKMITASGGISALRTNAGLQQGSYWSSTERDSPSAWCFGSNKGVWSNYNKSIDCNVRSALAF